MTARTHPLVDARTGVITAVVRQPSRPGVPRSYVSQAARVAAVGRVTGWAADPFAYGAALCEPSRAWWAAVGEAVERYCGNAPRPHAVVASYEQLVARGLDAVDPATLALYSQEQYGARGFPFVPFARDLVVGWEAVEDLACGCPTLVPASLVGLNPVASQPAMPRTHHLLYPGIAAGPSLVAARTSAVEELFERDAVTIWWHSGSPATGIRWSGCPRLAALLADPEAAALRWTLLHVPSSGAAPVVGALLEDRARGVVAFGSACRPSAEAAARKAVTEALQEHALALDLLDPDSGLWRAVRAGVLPGPGAGHRTDRRYVEDYRADLRDATDLLSHAQLWLDERWHDEHLDRLRHPGQWVDLEHLPRIDPEGALSQHVRAATGQGLRVVAADLTTEDVRSTGLRVARVMIPGLYANAPAAFPFLGGDRLLEEPVALGLVAHRLREADLVRRPLPYA